MIKNDNLYEKRIQIAVNDFIKIEILGHVVSSGNTRGFWHSHPLWELIYVHKGSGVHHCEDITAEGNADTLFLIPPQLKHNFENVISYENENLYIGFSCNPNNTLDTVIRDFDYTLEGMPRNELLKMHLREMIELVKKSEYSNQKIKTGNLIEGCL